MLTAVLLGGMVGGIISAALGYWWGYRSGARDAEEMHTQLLIKTVELVNRRFGSQSEEAG